MAEVELANLLMMQGDTEGARGVYQSVMMTVQPARAAAAASNLAVLLIAGHVFDEARQP